MCAGVSEELRRVKSGSIVYQFMSARLYPVRMLLVRLLYSIPEGSDDSTHDEGDLISMPFSVLSKSSIYDALLCTSFDVPASNRANSAVRLMLDGAVHSNSGNLSRRLVSHWLSFFHDRLKPQRVLLSGSEPISTFEVRGFSCRVINVPPKLNSSENSYCQLRPSIVLRCILNIVLLSSDTFTFVPASIIF